MSEESKETLIHTNTILEAINSFRQEVNERFNKVEERFNKIEARLSRVENEIADMKNLQLSFDVRLDRLESMSHEALQVAYSVRADVKVLRAEVTAWAQDVMELQQKVA